MTDLDTPPAAPPAPPALSPVGLARWAWRQLTSMRTALVLLLLLALAAVPGSVLPQRNVDAFAVDQWLEDHETLGAAYERLGLFSVYTSVWFSAIYILLMVSLVGCIVPRTRVYWRALRAAPPAAPRNLARLPAYHRVEVDGPAEQVLEAAEQALRSRRFRVRPRAADGSGDAVGAERGYLREAGNLTFHVAVVVTLVGFAIGQLLGYQGTAIVMVGQGFSNSLSQYDDFTPGSLFDVDDLAPLSLTVEDFDVDYQLTGPEAGQATGFTASLSYTEQPGGPERQHALEVNQPLRLDGVNVFLIGNGYAPVFTVRDGNGDVAFRGPVAFLPTDPLVMTSFGVVKVPDARPEQLGFEGEFYPTYQFSDETGPYSSFPDAFAPAVSLLAYHGDLGMDQGRPQNVYDLVKTGLTKFERPGAREGDARGTDLRVNLRPGERAELPDGLGSVELEGFQRWVRIQVSNGPGQGLALGGVLLALAGLMGSLFVRPRRVWVRARTGEGRTLVEVAGLDRGTGSDGLGAEVEELARQVTGGPQTQETM